MVYTFTSRTLPTDMQVSMNLLILWRLKSRWYDAQADIKPWDLHMFG
jgi:hypothetical protein